MATYGGNVDDELDTTTTSKPATQFPSWSWLPVLGADGNTNTHGWHRDQVDAERYATELNVLPTLPSLSFLIESPAGKKAVFDLAVPFDPLNSYAPAVVEQILVAGFEATVDKHIADILKDGGVNPASINSVIWSHYHYDHIGDIRTFPFTTEIVVGPGFSKAYLPGYPTNPNSTLRDSYFT